MNIHDFKKETCELTAQLADVKSEMVNQQKTFGQEIESLKTHFENKCDQFVETIRSIQSDINDIKYQSNSALRSKLHEKSMDETINYIIYGHGLTQMEYAYKHQFECMNTRINEVESDNNMNEGAIEDLLNAIDLYFTRCTQKTHCKSQDAFELKVNQHPDCSGKVLPIINELLEIERDENGAKYDALDSKINKISESHEYHNALFDYSLTSAKILDEWNQFANTKRVDELTEKFEQFDKLLEKNRMCCENLQTQMSNVKYELDLKSMKNTESLTEVENRENTATKINQNIEIEKPKPKPNFIASRRYAARRFVGAYDKFEYTRQFVVRITDANIHDVELSINEIGGVFESILGRDFIESIRVLEQRLNNDVVNRIELIITLQIPLNYEYLDRIMFPVNWDFYIHAETIEVTRFDTEH